VDSVYRFVTLKPDGMPVKKIGHQRVVASGTLGNGARNVMQSADWKEVKNNRNQHIQDINGGNL